jgi:hypothetical protein
LNSLRFFESGMSDACDCCTLGFKSFEFIKVFWIWHVWCLRLLHLGIQKLWFHYMFFALACLVLVTVAPWVSKALNWLSLFGIGISGPCDSCTLAFKRVDFNMVFWHRHVWSVWLLHPGIRKLRFH